MAGTGATVVAMADARAAGAEAQDWSSFASASAAAAEADAAAVGDEAALAAFCGSWLALTARQAPRTRQALLLLAEQPGQPYRAAAAWPDPRRDLSALGPAAERALREACGLATGVDGQPPRAGQPARLAYPVAAQGRCRAVVVMDLADGAAPAVQEGLRALHWSSGWLLACLQGRAQGRQAQQLAHHERLNGVMALALEAPGLDASALAVANRLAQQFGCSRVGVGLEEGGSVRLRALSHSAHFDPRSDTARALAEAMDEALDLGRPLAVRSGPSVGAAAPERLPADPAAAPPADPPSDPSSDPSTRAPHPAAPQADGAWVQADVARRLQVAALASVPICQGPRTLGALTLERLDGPGFTADELDALQQLGTWLAPVWALQRQREQPWPALLGERAAALWPALQRPGRLLMGGLAALALLAAALVPWPHRVAARTQLEGLSQQAVLAPFDGFLAESFVRAGDRVRAGQPLARLDDRAQRLELARWQSERDQQQRRWQIAMAQGDRAAAGVATAQLAQSDAMLSLAQERLARATLVAPSDAVVVAGDWHSQIGAAVETGRTLFELAPPDGHRVVLKVDDADIARLAPGQRGELVLASLADRAWAFTVTTVMPVAAAAEGHNLFRVEGRLDARDQRLRPGMEGVAKVQVGERSALWVATHGLVDALRMALWGVAP